MIVWDRGTWEPVGRPARRAWLRERSSSDLHGEKLAGLWELVRIAEARRKAGAVDDVQEEATRGRSPSRGIRRHHGACRTVSWPSPSGLLEDARSAPGGPASRRADAPPAPQEVASALKVAPAAVPAALAGASGAAVGDPRRRSADDWRLDRTRSSSTAIASWRVSIEGGKCDALHSQRARLDRRGCRALAARGGASLRYQERELARLRDRSSWAPDRHLPSFNALQNAFDRVGSGEHPVYFVFDVPYLDGKRSAPGLPLRIASRHPALAARSGSHHGRARSALVRTFDAPTARACSSRRAAMQPRGNHGSSVLDAPLRDVGAPRRG